MGCRQDKIAGACWIEAVEVEAEKAGEEEALLQVAVVKEQTVSIYAQAVHLASLVCSGGEIEELVTGYLFTQGYIRQPDDIRHIRIVPGERHIRAEIEGRIGRGTGVVLTSTAALCGEGEADLGPMPRAEWKKEWIFSLAERFARGTKGYRQTHGLHSCMLAEKGTCLYQCEDIGRHNALDKAIGHGLRDDVDLSACILYSSGRIPEDMIRKVIRSKVPVIATNSVPTDGAVRLAKAYHVVLLGEVRTDRMVLFSDR